MDTPDDELVSLFREKLFFAAADWVEMSTAPLMQVHDGKAIARSGIFLQIGEDLRFLVTAGHYLKELMDGGCPLMVVMPAKGLAPVLLSREVFKTTKSEQEDISVAKLEPETVAALDGHYQYIRLSSLMSRHDSRQGQGCYFLMGFPEAMIRPDADGIKKCDTWKVLTKLYDGPRSRIENYDPELHIVVDYERRTHNREGDRVHPPGMSGCGIWFVGSALEIVTKDTFRLVGIQNAWRRTYEYAKGTWIDLVLWIIWKYFPEARAPMEVNRIHF